MIKILVIEDNQDILENTREILELSNYEVYTAKNGETGVEQAFQNAPQLILCDIMMPELDGYGVLERIQSYPGLRITPFIFMSAKAEPMEIVKGLALGAHQYITKPFSAEELLRTIEDRLIRAGIIHADETKHPFC